MRVLVCTTGGPGHIYPVIPLALEIQRKGHDVVWATARGSCSIVEGFGIATRPAGLMPDERNKRFFQSNPGAFSMPPRERRPVAFAGFFATTAGPVMMEDLIPLFDELKPDLVVHETSELAATPLATARDIPSVTVAFSGRLPTAVMTAGVAAAAPLWSRFGLDVPDDLGLYADAFLHPFAPSLGQRSEGTTVHDMRPLAMASPSSDPPEWLAAMGTHRPLVYATYGTENGPGAPWKAIFGALRSVDVDAVVTVGRGVDLRSFDALLGGVDPGQIRIEHFVPQSLLMERAAAVISHGGAGSMLAAGIAGVPQMTAPIGADQFENTDAFVAAGVATSIEDDIDDGTTFVNRLRGLLEDRAYKERAEHLAQEFAEMPGPEVLASQLTRGG